VSTDREDPEREPDLTQQWTAVVRGVQAAQQRVLAAVADSELPGQWFAASQLLLAAPDRRLPMSRIARDLSMTTGGFTKLADRLAREGLIDRRGAAGDRRVIYATLTDRGLELAQAGAQVYADAVREHVLNTISADELATLTAVVGRLAPATEDPEVEDTEADDGPFVAKPRPPASPDRRSRGTRPASTATQAPRP
jgi:DNA-binding MarR family transcriptional regulator